MDTFISSEAIERINYTGSLTWSVMIEYKKFKGSNIL